MPETPDASLINPRLAELIRLFGVGDYVGVAALAKRYGALHPANAMLPTLAGAAYAAMGDEPAAEDAFGRALALDPASVDAHYNLAILLHRQGAAAQAEQSYRTVIALHPAHVQAANNLAVLLKDTGRAAEAVAACAAALAHMPGFRDAHVNQGNALTDLGRFAEALTAYDRALKIDPACSEAHANRGNALQELGLLEPAVAAFDAALACDAANQPALLRKLHIEARLCDWNNLRRTGAGLAELGLSGAPVHPLGMLSLEDAPERHRARAERFVAANFGWAAPRVALPAPRDARGNPARRIRIGYFSADFKEHPVAQLIVGVLAAHDRARFEVFAYALSPAPADTMRERIAASVDHFRDVAWLADGEAAALVHADELDLAVDLTGHTRQSRTGLFARRLAPVQIAHLGYPGTMGAPFIDYLVADRCVIPPEMRAHFTEKLLVLPHSFQPNDDTRAVSDKPMTRAEFGLPESGFVFCAFNAAYKITPAEWTVWMELLRAAPDSVLWLADPGERARANLKREAAALGVAADRLVFTSRVADPAEHIARHRLADLFLDTFAYNAHTTASDALWGGLPVLTMAGRSFAARVAASLLQAAGLAELITESRDDYAALALALARDPVRLGKLRARLEQNRRTCPLFDTARYTRDLESAFSAAIDREAAGLAPQDISVAADARQS